MMAMHKQRLRLLAEGSCCVVLGFGLSHCIQRGATVKAVGGSNFDRSKYPYAERQEDAFANVERRIVGVDPNSPVDADSGIGMKNIADAMGFKYAFNSCNIKMDVVDQGQTLRPVHNNGMTEEGRCNQVSSQAWVNYSFSDWRIKQEGLEVIPGKPDDKDQLPAFSPGSNGTLGVPTVTVNDRTGRLEVTSPDVVSQTAVNRSNSETKLRVDYKLSLANNSTTSIARMDGSKYGLTVTLSSKFGLPVVGEVTATAAASYEYTVQTTTTDQTSKTETRDVSCAAEITQPVGCQYKLVLSASRVVSRGNYRAYLSAIPQVVKLQGQLSDIQYCYKTGYRRSDGVCKTDIEKATFGEASGRNFIEHVRYLADHPNDDEHWLWSQAVADKDHQTGGKSDFANAASNWEAKSFSRFAVDFYDVQEAVTDCKVEVQVLAGGDNCNAPAPQVSKQGVGS